MALFLQDILEKEKIIKPIFIGQIRRPMLFGALSPFPGGLIAIDSAPLKRSYITAAELWLLKRTELIYKSYPWKSLLNHGAKRVAKTKYGRRMMREMMEEYTKDEFSSLACHGFRILAETIALNRGYRIDCPCLLLCGSHDKAGSARRYNRVWARKEHLPLIWIPNAGHNVNADRPELVNAAIESFMQWISP